MYFFTLRAFDRDHQVCVWVDSKIAGKEEVQESRKTRPFCFENETGILPIEGLELGSHRCVPCTAVLIVAVAVVAVVDVLYMHTNIISLTWAFISFVCLHTGWFSFLSSFSCPSVSIHYSLYCIPVLIFGCFVYLCEHDSEKSCD